MIDAIQAVDAVGATTPSSAVNGVTDQQEQNVFIDMLTQVDASVASATEALSVAAKGESEAPVHELMIALEVSKLQLQMLVEVRNKVVEGYQELTRMQV